MTHRNIGTQVKKLRKQKFIQRDAFALKIGLSVEQYKNVERGRKEIDDDLLEKIEQTLGEKLSVDALHGMAS